MIAKNEVHMDRRHRDYSVELLRCVLMFLIVLCHAFGHGEWKNSQAWWALLFTALIHWHVDGFVAISGWYGIKFSFKKYFRLWGLFCFYSLLSVLYSHYVLGRSIGLRDLKVYGGWFGGAYMMLMFLAPFLNAGLEKCASCGCLQAWKCWGTALLMFFLFITPFRSVSGVYDPSDGFSPLMLVMVYVTARLVRLTGVGDRLGQRKTLFLSFGFLVVSVFLFYGVLNGLGVANPISTISPFFSFYAPPIYCFGIVLVCFVAQRIVVHERIGRIIALISPSMLGVYLLHETTSFGHEFYRPLQGWLFHTEAVGPGLIVILSALFTFLCCVCIDLVRRLLLFAISSSAKGVKGAWRCESVMQ